MAIPPLIGNPYNGYINPYYWVDEFIPYYIQMLQEGKPNQSHAGSDRLIGREDCSQTFNHQDLHFSNWDDCIFAYIDPIKINHSWIGKYTIHGIVSKFWSTLVHTLLEGV